MEDNRTLGDIMLDNEKAVAKIMKQLDDILERIKETNNDLRKELYGQKK